MSNQPQPLRLASSAANSAEIGELIATIAHEIRNPLTTILLGLSRCQSLELPETDRLRIELALSEAHRLDRLVKDLQTRSLVPCLQARTLELNAFAREILTLFECTSKHRGRLVRLVCSDLPIWTIADRHKLTQVFLNLLDNAGEATIDSEPICWRFVPAPSERQVSIEIHNWGEPIPPQLLGIVTQPFVTTKANGRGLGLSIVRKIVAAHQGTLAIESSSEAGTTVRIQLPTIDL
jgi:signal transduction histidine kinase